MTGPLSGLRIVDLTTIMMGPWCTRIVGDLGADVIKVEAPEGDSSRYGGNARNRGMGGGFQHTARRKRSLVLDVGDCGFMAIRNASAHQGDWKRVQRACGFGAHVAAIGAGHRELATDGRTRFVDAAVHPRAVQRDAPAVGVARHHRHALFVAFGHMRGDRVFLEQHHREAATQGVAAIAVHAFFADRRMVVGRTQDRRACGRRRHRRTASTPSIECMETLATMEVRVMNAGMSAPGSVTPMSG